jgi:hypothetical protein
MADLLTKVMDANRNLAGDLRIMKRAVEELMFLHKYGGKSILELKQAGLALPVMAAIRRIERGDLDYIR